MKDKTTAALLAIFLGGIGGHKFYLGQTGMGILYLLFFWTTIPAFVGFIEGIILLTMNPQNFDRRFNYDAPQSQYLQQPNIIIQNQLAPPSNRGSFPDNRYSSDRNYTAQVEDDWNYSQPSVRSSTEPEPSPKTSVADEIMKLNELRVAGVITEEEFQAHKQRLLR